MAAVTDPTLNPPPTDQVAPPDNPTGNGLVNNPAPGGNPTAPAAPTQPTLPAPLPVTPVSPTTSVNGTAGQATATPYTVQPAGLVQERVKGIVADDSDLMRLARNQATQEMSARGLANSSLNTSAGEQAVIAQALPIATQDAASINTAMTNTANAQNTASLTNAQLETSMNTTNANAKNNALSASALAENTRNLAAIDNNNKQALAVLSQQNSELLQTNTNAANMFSETVKNIAGISVNDTMTKAAKDAAIATQLNLLNQGLLTTQAVGGTVPAEVQGLNLGEFFQTATGTAEFTPAQRATQITNLQNQLDTQTQRLKDLGQGIGVPVLTGPNASERRKPIWDQLTAETVSSIKQLRDQIAALQKAGTT
jgi:hypothetical protein